MNHQGNIGVSRRELLSRTAQISALGISSSYALGLNALGSLAAQNAESGYKALVCIFMLGGNDHANTLIPYDQSNYAKYFSARGGKAGVAIEQAALKHTRIPAPRNQTLTDNQELALAPELRFLKALYDQGQLSPILNVGPLLAPITKAQFESNDTARFPRPEDLFAHNHQQTTWQSFDVQRLFGWGGHLGEMVRSQNSNAMFTAMTPSGTSLLLSGESSTSYRIGTSGAPIIRGISGSLYGSGTASNALNSILKQSSTHLLENDYAKINARAIEFGEFVNSALERAPSFTSFGEGNSLAAQLSTVAKIIASRDVIGNKRQIFLVTQGGYDTHSNQRARHSALLSELDQAIQQFQNAMISLNVSDQVTAFTASDFGRTLSPNGDGTDHGWGGHQFVFGGAVNGGQFYGVAPKISLDSDGQVGRGRLIPSVSNDQYVSTLARWFGLDGGQVAELVPNIGRFDSSNLGFMKQ